MKLTKQIVQAICIAIVPAIAATTAYAVIPLLMSHQGIIMVGGEPFTGDGQFRFAIVDVESDTKLWTNDGTGLESDITPTGSVILEVIDGKYSVILGNETEENMTPLPSNVFNSDNIALRIWFDDGVNGPQLLSPDQLITSSAFAFEAGNADTVDGIHAADLEESGEITAHDSNPGAHASIEIDASKITSGVIAPAHLGDVDAETLDGLDSTELAPTGHGHDFFDIDGEVFDDQVPDDITIDYAFFADEADSLQGYDPTDFAPETHFHPALTTPGSVEGDSTEIVSVTDTGNVNITADIDMEGVAKTFNKIFNLADPSAPQDAATKNYVDTQVEAVALTKLVRNFADGSGGSIYAGQVVSFLNNTVVGGTNSLNPGQDTSFASSSVTSMSAAALSNSTFVVAYAGTSGTVQIGKISDDTITFYPQEIPFNEGATDSISVAALSDSEFVVIFEDDDDSSRGKASVGEVADDFSVSYLNSAPGEGWGETEFTFETSPIDIKDTSVTRLSDSTFGFAYSYQDSVDWWGRANMGTISDTGVTYAFSATYSSSGTATENSVATASDGNFFVAYKHSLGSNSGRFASFEKSGSSLISSTPQIFSDSEISSPSIGAFSDDKVAIAFIDNNDSSKGKTIIADITGSGYNASASFGPSEVFTTSSVNALGLVITSTNNLAIAYSYGSSTYASFGNVSGKFVSFGTEITLANDILANLIFPLRLSSNSIVTCYAISAGTAVNAVITDVAVPVGIADAAPSGGIVPVILNGIADHYSGLTPGRTYYVESDGSVVDFVTSAEAGLAISSTEILLKIK